MEFYVWRDARDADAFMIGSLKSSGGLTCWAYVYVDGIQDMFGQAVYAKARLLGASDILRVTGDLSLSE